VFVVLFQLPVVVLLLICEFVVVFMGSVVEFVVVFVVVGVVVGDEVGLVGVVVGVVGVVWANIAILLPAINIAKNVLFIFFIFC
jgi:hypothetical protein